MTKSELIERVAEKNPNLMLKDIEKIVNIILDKIIKTLAEGGRVEFRGFGAFTVRRRGPRFAKNPRTGNRVTINERNIAHFKMGTELHNLINKPE